MKAVGVDIGFGYTKVYGDKGKESIPTLVAPFSKGEALTEEEIVEFDGKTFLIGSRYVDLRGTEFPFTDEYRAMLYYALRNYEGEVLVGLGVPPSWGAKREEIEKLYSGKHKFYYKDKQRELNLKVKVFLQGWGGYIDYIYNLEGGYQEERDVPAIYSDWGFYTIDTIVTERAFVNGKWVVKPRKPEDATIPKGVSRLLEILKIILEEEGVFLPDLRLLEHYLLSGTRYKKEIEEAKKRWISEVVSELQRKYEKYIPYVEKIVIFGGGANLVGELFEMKFGEKKVPVTKLDQFANARGYYKFLKAVGVK